MAAQARRASGSATPAPATPVAAPVVAEIPDPRGPRELFDGDRTTADQFRAGLPLTPRSGRAELIRGTVRLNDRPPNPRRAALAEALKAWARQYEVETAGVVRAVDVRATLSPRDEVFCDAALYVPAAGRCSAAAGDDGPVRLVGPPDVVVCVASADGSSARSARDLYDRAEALRVGGVTELIFAGPVDGAGYGGRDGVRWYRLDDAPDRPGRGDGYLKSAALPGLWLPEAVLGPDPARVDVAGAVRAGCGTLDHALFVNALCAGRAPR